MVAHILAKAPLFCEAPSFAAGLSNNRLEERNMRKRRLYWGLLTEGFSRLWQEFLLECQERTHHLTLANQLGCSSIWRIVWDNHGTINWPKTHCLEGEDEELTKKSAVGLGVLLTSILLLRKCEPTSSIALNRKILNSLSSMSEVLSIFIASSSDASGLYSSLSFSTENLTFLWRDQKCTNTLFIVLTSEESVWPVLHHPMTAAPFFWKGHERKTVFQESTQYWLSLGLLVGDVLLGGRRFCADFFTVTHQDSDLKRK